MVPAVRPWGRVVPSAPTRLMVLVAESTTTRTSPWNGSRCSARALPLATLCTVVLGVIRVGRVVSSQPGRVASASISTEPACNSRVPAAWRLPAPRTTRASGVVMVREPSLVSSPVTVTSPCTARLVVAAAGVLRSKKPRRVSPPSEPPAQWSVCRIARRRSVRLRSISSSPAALIAALPVYTQASLSSSTSPVWAVTSRLAACRLPARATEPPSRITAVVPSSTWGTSWATTPSREGSRSRARATPARASSAVAARARLSRSSTITW